MIRLIKFLEKMWLMLAIVTFIIGLLKTYQNQTFDALFFFGFSAISIFLFAARRNQRRSHERKNKQ